MQHRHGFLHSNKSDQNKPKHHYWVQKSGLGSFLSFLDRTGATFHFWPELVHRFIFGPNQCIQCNPSMVFSTVTKLNKRTKTSLLGPEKWIGSVSFVSGPNRCMISFSAQIAALNATPAWL